jgi:hypothetical protein
MGNVISFKKRKKRKKKFNQNKKKSKTVTEKSTTEYPAVLDPLKDGSIADVDYADMEPEEKIEYWKNIEKEEEERFKAKYSNVLVAVPVSDGEKMQYFSNIMLQLLPDVFHGSSWDERFDAWMDFSQFYITGFDSAYSDYIKANKEFEQPYHYKFQEMATEKLEEELVDCLGKIIELCPEKKEEDKTEMLYQAARLFELEEILSDIFYKELMKE